MTRHPYDKYEPVRLMKPLPMPTIEEMMRPTMSTTFKVQAWDAVKIPAMEWDRTPPSSRYPYKEKLRKHGYVYAIKDEGET